jgi:hypothetical protein
MLQALIINLCIQASTSARHASESYWSASGGKRRCGIVKGDQTSLRQKRIFPHKELHHLHQSAFWTWTCGNTRIGGGTDGSVAATSGRTRRRQNPSFRAWITTCIGRARLIMPGLALGRSLVYNYPRGIHRNVTVAHDHVGLLLQAWHCKVPCQILRSTIHTPSNLQQ